MKKAFSSVYIVIMLSSLIFFLLCLLEAGTGKAAASMSNNAVYLAGESVLSEYNKELQKKYGIYAVTKNDEYLTEKAKHYIDYSFLGFRNVVKLKTVSVSASAIGFEATNRELFKTQVVRLGALCTAKELYNALSKVESDQVDTQNDLEELASEPDVPPDENGEGGVDKSEQREQANQLKTEYKQAVKSYGNPLLVITGGLADVSVDDLAIDEYILYVREENDGEYILYGYDDAAVNKAFFTNSLFWSRFGINAVNLVSDPKSFSKISEEAAAFYAIPYPIAFAAVLSIHSAIQSGVDVAKILTGGCVPIVKSIKDYGDYEDYMRLFLALVPEDTKLDRLMNVIETHTDHFSFADYAYGFKLEARVKKKTYAPDVLTRKKTIEQTHAYE